ncbi:putative trifolitoxin immunity protein [Streptomyces zinciresistens K42]|uniref:Putative trifolitoxin immunity protein n=1 Tax=Streptomyces zinciresistens K42 TaxID=700597 RepID=G2GMX8_9ACTN|nr:putative trifolitoxin immunity protein [Streptomyces zinciresistens K42]
MRERERVLEGGAVHDVVRIGSTVRRAPHERYLYVRELLDLLERREWDGAPRHIGSDARGREVFGYIEGRAAVTAPERAAAGADGALVQVARLTRALHDITHGTSAAGGHDVVCHNALAPGNTVYTVEDGDWWPIAFIDWDLAAPGDRVHDLAHVCWRYLGLGPAITDVPDAARRIALVCDAYGLGAARASLLDEILARQERCLRGIEAAAAHAEPPAGGPGGVGAADEVRGAHAWVAAHRRQLAMFLG